MNLLEKAKIEREDLLGEITKLSLALKENNQLVEKVIYFLFNNFRLNIYINTYLLICYV